MRLPSKDQLEYARLAMIVVLLALAIPLVLLHSWRDPIAAGEKLTGTVIH